MFYSFFFNDTATTEIYTLSLHDALPIWKPRRTSHHTGRFQRAAARCRRRSRAGWLRRAASSSFRSEEHTSELQSHSDLVCRLLLEKKNKHNRQRIQQYKYSVPRSTQTYA